MNRYHTRNESELWCSLQSRLVRRFSGTDTKDGLLAVWVRDLWLHVAYLCLLHCFLVTCILRCMLEHCSNMAVYSYVQYLSSLSSLWTWSLVADNGTIFFHSHIAVAAVIPTQVKGCLLQDCVILRWVTRWGHDGGWKYCLAAGCKRAENIDYSLEIQHLSNYCHTTILDFR